ncbi:hypothetical protein VN97_g3029 [Penicillium thymicola]|uniref:Uncharacterized protein n=1 Tax=Penicillium thymicola TaxID=293382 RepID=A0AAI9TN66_PENTH|nr:hypothetical protein VN97_g3029 [Penicillium thymicola]
MNSRFSPVDLTKNSYINSLLATVPKTASHDRNILTAQFFHCPLTCLLRSSSRGMNLSFFILSHQRTAIILENNTTPRPKKNKEATRSSDPS